MKSNRLELIENDTHDGYQLIQPASTTDDHSSTNRSIWFKKLRVHRDLTRPSIIMSQDLKASRDNFKIAYPSRYVFKRVKQSKQILSV